MNLYGGPGTEGYISEDSDEYISGFAFDRVIDPDQVASVLFYKTTNGNGDVTEEPEYYEVAVK